jgi:hypothetical protein
LNRLIILTLVVLAATTTTLQTQSAQSDAAGVEAVKKQISALDQQLNDAAVQGNMKFFSKTMSEGYVGVALNGMILGQSLIAAHYQAGTLRYESVVNSDIDIMVHDNCAVLTAISAVKGHDGDTDLSGVYRIMRVFSKHNGGLSHEGQPRSAFSLPYLRVRFDAIADFGLAAVF